MKRLTLLTLLAAAALGPVYASTNVGVSIGISQPGVYGRIDIGNMAPPPVVYAQPVIVAPQPVVVHRQPVYLYVPPQHQANWKNHCGAYGACAQPVYFVQETWVKERHQRAYYSPRSEDRAQGNGKGKGKGHKGQD